MGLFDFLAPKRDVSQVNPLFSANDLVFKHAMASVEYARDFMKTEWREGHISVAVIGEATIQNGIMSALTLIPRGTKLQQMPTFTRIVGRSSPGSKLINVAHATLATEIGLRTGDLVTVSFLGKSKELVTAVPETEGWVVAVVAKTMPRFSVKHDGWVTDIMYHL
jgi:hypothetical protein